MKLTTLIENLVYQPKLVAEHGLSFFLDTGKRRILFDSGQSGAFLSNARELNIDLSTADALVISHGHYDHTGGLDFFLKENERAHVYIKKEALDLKYNRNKNFIGTSSVKDHNKHRFHFIDEITEIDDGVFIVPHIPIVHKTDTSFGYFYTDKGDGFMEDEFNDELFLAVVNKGKISVISSCSHRGISNITEESRRLFQLPLHLITGGFHLKGAPVEQTRFVIDYFKQVKPELIGVCHCTGVENLPWMKEAIGDAVFYNYTGNVIQI